MLKRRKFLRWGGLASTSLLLPLTACRKVLNTPEANKQKSLSQKTSFSNGGLTFSKCATNKGAYLAGESVTLSLDVQNITGQTIQLNELHVFFKDISDPYATFNQTVTLATNITIAAGQTYSIVNKPIWTVPSYALLNAFGEFIGGTFQNNSTIPNTFMTFFRVVNQNILTTFKITAASYQGLSVHLLDGGMSAEYAIGKAAENLSAGVAHSWYPSAPGSGPRSVYSTTRFLEASVNNTVNYYNQQFGSTTTFDTVVISTGVASIPYLSRTMKAPVLPLHFLVSADTVKEIAAILQYSKDHGYDAYSVLGYDGSVAKAVSWIKLLRLPPQYITFLQQHNVKNIVITGTTTLGAGEGTAKKILYNNTPSTGYNQSDIFLLYTQGGTTGDFDNLYSRIKDLHDYDNLLESNYRQISDWESGVADEQINNFSAVAKSQTGVTSVQVLTATVSGGTLELYNLATYLTLSFMQKNNLVFGSNPVLGVAMNPYLLSHPLYETKIQYLPFLYWQGGPPSSIVDRLTTSTKNTILSYFPNTNFNGLSFWVNTSKNFGGFQASGLVSELQARGLLNITKSNETIDEVWNPNDGMSAICERVASNILQYSSPAALKTWDNTLVALAPADLVTLASRHSNIIVIQK
ncbi:hypothetical protein [Agriterribacter sp.]|uniref:hypothetical protein n=1 Tax=Agriterribacter sp. TaxID=2821509 RepID=UPI002C8395D0|nr:hypothetical protein [Agriterribacter sp.]HRO46015.1 hypothetical protein [Agriterribacter sp.]HRQ17051.1 hypothetical protein [Agriterribacter sp.]